MSRVLGENKTHLSTNTYGTISYMAPELLSEGKLGKPADVYSFAILSALPVSPILESSQGILRLISGCHMIRPDYPYFVRENTSV